MRINRTSSVFFSNKESENGISDTCISLKHFGCEKSVTRLRLLVTSPEKRNTVLRLRILNF